MQANPDNCVTVRGVPSVFHAQQGDRVAVLYRAGDKILNISLAEPGTGRLRRMMLGEDQVHDWVKCGQLAPFSREEQITLRRTGNLAAPDPSDFSVSTIPRDGQIGELFFHLRDVEDQSGFTNFAPKLFELLTF